MNELLQILGAISDPVSLVLGAVFTAIPSYFLYKKGIKVTELKAKTQYDQMVLTSRIKTIDDHNSIYLRSVSRCERNLERLGQIYGENMTHSDLETYLKLSDQLKREIAKSKSELLVVEKDGTIVFLNQADDVKPK